MQRITRAAQGSWLLLLGVLALGGCQHPAPVEAGAPQLLGPVCANGECALLNQDGSLHRTFASPSGASLTLGYFAFADNGKFGVVDDQGRIIQPARFDALRANVDYSPVKQVGAATEFIIYSLDGRQGVLDASAQVLTDALFDSIASNDDVASQGGWLSAKRGGANWLINLKSGEHKPVDFDRVLEAANQHLLVSSAQQGMGLADAQGQLVTPQFYPWLGTPGLGLTAFRQTADGPCGYLDDQGQTVIAPRFASCAPFGRQGALVKARGDEPHGKRYGLIGHDGQWRGARLYDSVDAAGYTALGMLNEVPGYNRVGQQPPNAAMSFGVFDLERGVERLPAVYTQVGVINPELFVFSTQAAPSQRAVVFDQAVRLPTVGVMDAAARVLIAPGRYVDILPTPSGQYLWAIGDVSRTASVALYDLKGRLLIAPRWQELLIDEARGLVFAYAVTYEDYRPVRSLAALYRLDGIPLFQRERLPCGAEQVRNADGRVLWPATPLAHCLPAR